MPEDIRQDHPAPPAANEDEHAARQQEPLYVNDLVSAVILRPREPFLNWVRLHAQGEPATRDREAAASAVALTPELPRAEDQDAWLRQHGERLFTGQLEIWAPEAAWPADRSLEALRTWFDVEFVPAVDDLRAYHVQPEVTCAPISLADIVDQFDGIFEQGAVFVDVSSGAVTGLSEVELAAIDDGDATELGIPQEDLDDMRRAYESPSLVEVLSRADFDEFPVMEQFAESMTAASVRNRLLDALRGRKPFRRFKDAVYTAGVREKWFAWRQAAMADALKMALDDFEIPYVDDLDSGDTPGT